MKFKVLESSDLKDKYFYRTERWDWLNREMIHVIDSKRPRMITMDYWPQKIYLEAEGQRTVSEFIHFLASKYASIQVPETLDLCIIEELNKLVHELKIISLSDTPVQLDDTILKPLTLGGKVDMLGSWKGTYTYNIPEEFKDDKTQKVEFSIKIDFSNNNTFQGSVQDNLETGGTPGVGTINGTHDDFTMTFEKNMPIRATIKMDGSRTTDKKKKHPTIIYTGEFSGNKQTITGTWKFKKKALVWLGIIPYWITPGSGAFFMEKVKNND